MATTTEILDLIDTNPSADRQAVIDVLDAFRAAQGDQRRGYNLAIPYSIVVRPATFDGEEDPRFVRLPKR